MGEPRVTVYTTQYCGYCRSAKALLTRSGVPFREIDLTDDDDALEAVKRRTGHFTVPLVFVDDRFVGGYDDLSVLVRTEGASALL